MTHSVRLRFVDWLKSIGNHLPKHLMQKLGRAKPHTDACRHLGNARIVGINDTGSKAEANDIVGAAGFRDQINEMGRLASVPNLPAVSAHRQIVPGTIDYLVSHDQSPLAKDARTLNRLWPGVERGIDPLRTGALINTGEGE